MAELAFVPIPSREIPGLVAIIAVAVLSTFALLSIAFRWVWVTTKPSITLSSSIAVSREPTFYRTQLGLYAVCLLAANFFSSLAGLISLSWVLDKGIQEGTTCTAQAIIMQIGNVAAAYFTTVIPIHIFKSLVLRRSQGILLCSFVIVVGWVAAVVVATAPLLAAQPFGPLYGISALSCGVKRIYPMQQFLFHLLPIFMAAVISVVLYSLIFLILRGTLVLRGGVKFSLDPNHRWNGNVGTYEEYHRFIGAIARSMLWFPFAYVVLLLPYSITRLVDLSAFEVSFGANMAAGFCWFILGLVNVFLLFNTFRMLRRALDVVSSLSTRKTDVNSCSASEKSFFCPVPPPLHLESGAFSAAPISSPRRTGLSRLPVVPSRPLEWIHHRPPSNISSSSKHPLLPRHIHAASADSFNTVITHNSLQRCVTPISGSNRELMTGPGRRLEPYLGHLRTSSSNSISLARPSEPPGLMSDLSSAPRRMRSPVEQKPSLGSSSKTETISSTSTAPLAKYGRTSSKLSINMYPYYTPRVNFGAGTHSLLNDPAFESTARNSLPEWGTVLSPHPIERQHGLIRVPSLPTSVTNSTSSLTFASVASTCF